MKAQKRVVILNKRDTQTTARQDTTISRDMRTSNCFMQAKNQRAQTQALRAKGNPASELRAQKPVSTHRQRKTRICPSKVTTHYSALRRHTKSKTASVHYKQLPTPHAHTKHTHTQKRGYTSKRCIKSSQSKNLCEIYICYHHEYIYQRARHITDVSLYPHSKPHRTQFISKTPWYDLSRVE